MKRLWLGVGAAALILASVVSDEASARVGVGRVGVGRIGVGRVGVGFRPGLGVGFRPGIGVGWRPGVAAGWGWRGRGWGWGWPVAAGIAAGVAATSYYGNSCYAWNGYTWVNTCYGSYPYGYW